MLWKSFMVSGTSIHDNVGEKELKSRQNVPRNILVTFDFEVQC